MSQTLIIAKCYFHTVTSASSFYYLISAYNKKINVIMSNVTCVGDESRLIDCSYTSGGSGPPLNMTCTYKGKVPSAKRVHF